MHDKDNQVTSQNHRIKSYVLRQSHITPKQAKSLAELYPVWGIEYNGAKISLNEVFGRSNPKILEIGFGMGLTTAEMAKKWSDADFLGIEVHRPGVGNLLTLIEELDLTNLRVIRHDAVEVLENMLDDATFERIHIYFPDPWQKKKHHKRRLLQTEFVHMLAPKLTEGGYIHLATDWENYATQMLEVLSLEPLLENTCENFAPRPDYRPETKFEIRGKRLGHQVWDLIFRKQN